MQKIVFSLCLLMALSATAQTFTPPPVHDYEAEDMNDWSVITNPYHNWKLEITFTTEKATLITAPVKFAMWSMDTQEIIILVDLVELGFPLLKYHLSNLTPTHEFIVPKPKNAK